MSASTVYTALALTALGSLGTALGGLLVVLQPHMSFKRLGALQGLAAGLMLSISLLDLLPEAAEEIGFTAATLCFYAGVLLFALIVSVLPEPEGFLAEQLAAGGGAAQQQQQQLLQAAAAVAAHKKREDDADGSRPVVHVRACGAAAAAVRSPPDLSARSSPRSECSATSADLDVVLQDEDGDGKQRQRQQGDALRRQLLLSGLVTALGIALHNFPEGVAVFLAAQKSPAIGVSLAVAIALHNIPEGVAVALPVYFATGSRLKGLQTAVLSGLAEPLAVVLLGLLFPVRLDKSVVDCTLAAVGGIMAFLALHELVPLSLQHAGKSVAVACVFGGMFAMSMNLHLLNTYVLAGLH